MVHNLRKPLITYIIYKEQELPERENEMLHFNGLRARRWSEKSLLLHSLTFLETLDNCIISMFVLCR